MLFALSTVTSALYNVKMWFFVSNYVTMPPKNSQDRGKETAAKAKNSGGGKRKEGAPSNGTPKKKKTMAAKAKSVGGGKPKATKTYDGTSVKKKDMAAKTYMFTT